MNRIVENIEDLPGAEDLCSLEKDGIVAPKFKGLTWRSAAEIVAMVFTDSDKILGDRLLALCQSLILLGEAGIGKSRLLLQLIACVVTGRDFLGIETANSELKWLIIQSENSNRRLQKDLERLRTWLGEEDWLKFCERVRFHTMETDEDGFLSLENPDVVEAIEAEIQDFNPGVVVWDPLNEFSNEDLNPDANMRRVLQKISRTVKRGNPERAIVVLHHSLTGKAGANKATGYDRTSFGRNSKALVAWARAQINVAPGSSDPMDGLLVIACGKCSNGKPFDRFAAKLNPDSMIYERFPSFDWEAWEREISDKAPKTKKRDLDAVATLCGMPVTKAELAKKIAAEFGILLPNSYRFIKQAIDNGKIKYDRKNDKYLRA